MNIFKVSSVHGLELKKIKIIIFYFPIAISSILENTALFSDIVLNIPDISHRVLRKQTEWNPTIRWCYEFLNKTRDWIDDATLKAIHLASQELNLIPRNPNYVNPNRIKGPPSIGTSTKRAKRKKEPTITKIEL